ncbi:MAG TPA: Hsp20/alpha crystallin family protein [Rhodanobacteraceae bacterium]|nr:Hsp20/alpha crystallin family protein [Rhodanobacteraceae bacterium]
MYIERSAYWPAAGQFPREISRAFGRLFDGTVADSADVVTSAWAPRVDIREEDQRFVIEADIPGIDPKAIEISMDKGVLSIRGERKPAQDAADAGYTRVERVHGAFSRRFALPDSANPDGIRASGKFGVLEIEIPKRPETTPRKIDVAVD